MNLQRPDIVLDFTVLANDWLKILIHNYCDQPSCETANKAMSIEHSAELPIVQNARLFTPPNPIIRENRLISLTFNVLSDSLRGSVQVDPDTCKVDNNVSR